jgi:hypothetical protein
MGRLLRFSATAGDADVVKGDGAGSKEDEREGEGGESERKLGSPVAGQAVVEMHFGDGDGEIDADGKCGHAGEQACEDEYATEELGKGGEICGPAGESKAGDELNMVVEAAENFVVSVIGHDSAKSQTHDEKREGLQTIEKAQAIPPGEKVKKKIIAEGRLRGSRTRVRQGPWCQR